MDNLSQYQDGQPSMSPEMSMMKNFSKMPPLKIIRDPSKNPVKAASLLGISAGQLKKYQLQAK